MENTHQEMSRNLDRTKKPVSPIRRLFHHSAIYSISTSIQRLQGLIMTPIYTSPLYLPQMSDYSNYGLVYTFIAFMNFVYLFGMDSAFLRYYFLGKESKKTVFSTSFGVLVLSGLVTSALIFVFARPLAEVILFSGELANFIKLAALILFFDTIGNLPFLILRAEERAISFTVFRIMRFSFELILNIIFVVVLKRGVEGILQANIIASLLNLVIMSPIAIKYLNFSFKPSLLKEMVVFGLPFLPNGIAFMIIEVIDRFLVTDYLGKDVLAFYHANYKFASVLLLLVVGFRNAWQPFFLKISEQKEAPATYSRILNYYLFAAGLIIVCMTFFIKDILTFYYFNDFYLLWPSYWPGIDFIPWILLSYFFYGIYVIFTPAFYITKKSQYMVLFTGTGAILNIVTNIILLPRIGIWGAVIATVAAYLSMFLLIYFISQKLYPIPVNLKSLLGVFLTIGLGYLIYYIIGPNFLFRAIIFVLLGVFAFFTALSASQRKGLILSLTDRIKVKK